MVISLHTSSSLDGDRAGAANIKPRVGLDDSWLYCCSKHGLDTGSTLLLPYWKLRFVPFVSTGKFLVSLVMLEWQIGQLGNSPNENSLLIQQEQSSLLHVQMAVCSSGIGSTCFFEK